MIREKSIGGIIFLKEDNSYLFLLLYRKPHDIYKESWDFLKGNVEKNEDEIETLRREIKEETSIADFIIVNGFRDRISWFYRKDSQLTFKEAIYYLAEAKTKDVCISSEHDSFEWLSFDDAVKRITFKNAKTVLENAHNFLMKKEKGGLNRFL